MSWNARIKHEQNKRRHQGPPTAVKKVLVNTNPRQNRMLQEQVAIVDKDRAEAMRRMKWQRQTFVIDTAMKETELRELELPHISHLPEIDMKTTVPDVWARRPITVHRRSATWMMRELGMEPTNATERPVPEGQMITRKKDAVSSGTRRGPRPRSAAQAERHYGSNLPLYGQDHETARSQKRLKEVRRLQEELNSRNVRDDPRFCKLTDSLISPTDR